MQDVKENHKEKDVRYSLRLPSSLYDEIGKVATDMGTTRLDIIRKFIRIGLLVTKHNDDPSSGVYIRRSLEFERLFIV